MAARKSKKTRVKKKASKLLLPPDVVKQKFAIEFIRDFDPEKAYCRTLDCVRLDLTQMEVADALPRDPTTNEYIEKQLSYMQDRLVVDRDYLVLKTREILDQCMKATPVMEKIRGNWVEAGDFEFDSRGAVSAVRTLYEITGLKSQQPTLDPDNAAEVGVMLVPNPITVKDWDDMVQQTKDLQDENYTEVMESLNTESTKH